MNVGCVEPDRQLLLAQPCVSMFNVPASFLPYHGLLCCIDDNSEDNIRGGPQLDSGSDEASCGSFPACASKFVAASCSPKFAGGSRALLNVC